MEQSTIQLTISATGPTGTGKTAAIETLRANLRYCHGLTWLTEEYDEGGHTLTITARIDLDEIAMNGRNIA